MSGYVAVREESLMATRVWTSVSVVRKPRGDSQAREEMVSRVKNMAFWARSRLGDFESVVRYLVLMRRRREEIVELIWGSMEV